MRKLGDALLIAPALALLLLATLWGHVRRRPVIGVVAVIAIGTVALVALQRPVPSAATQPTVSHHLKVLRETGWVASERRASWVYYRLRPEAVARFGAIAGAMGGGIIPVSPRSVRVVQPLV